VPPSRPDFSDSAVHRDGRSGPASGRVPPRSGTRTVATNDRRRGSSHSSCTRLRCSRTSWSRHCAGASPTASPAPSDGGGARGQREQVSGASRWRSGPFRGDIERLTVIPGVSTTAVLAEVGPDMSTVPPPDHLASWAELCPRLDERRQAPPDACAQGVRRGSRRCWCSVPGWPDPSASAVLAPPGVPGAEEGRGRRAGLTIAWRRCRPRGHRAACRVVW